MVEKFVDACFGHRSHVREQPNRDEGGILLTEPPAPSHWRHGKKQSRSSFTSRLWAGTLKATTAVCFNCPSASPSLTCRVGEEYRRIKTLLDAPDPSSNYLAAKSQRDPGSGHWLMEDKRYDAWKNASPSLLWLHGIRKISTRSLNLCKADSYRSRLWKNSSLVSR